MKILISDLKEIISNKKFKEILINNCKIINILFIPSTFSLPSKTNKYVLETIDLLKSIGITINEWDVLLNKDDISETEFSKYQLIYLMGGSVTEQNLMHEELNKKLSLYKGTVLGISAGALNMCSEVILTSIQLESSTTKYFKGIGLIDNYIEVHFDINNQKQCLELVESNRKVICISNTGCYVEDDNTKEFIGKVYMCEDGKFVSVGE